MTPYRVEPLAAHDRTTFTCGVEMLDRYFHRQATQDVARGLAAVFVMCEATTNRVVGYYTLSAFTISFTDLPERAAKNLPSRIPLPATLLGRLAIDTQYRGHGLGGALFVNALLRAYDNRTVIGSMAVMVHAIDANAAQFYARYGFLALNDDPLHLFLPMKDIARFRS